MSDDWAEDELDEDDLEELLAREEAEELTPAGIARQNQSQLKRQRVFRRAADAVVDAWRRRPEVQAITLFGSVAQPLWKEVPRFSPYRRARIKIWHDINDLDLAVWLANTDDLNGLRRVKNRALADLYQRTGSPVAHHHVDGFVMEPGTNRYLGRLCTFDRCPKNKPECLVPGCGAVSHLQQFEDFTLSPNALAPDRTIRLFDRQAGLLRRAAEVAVAGLEDSAIGDPA